MGSQTWKDRLLEIVRFGAVGGVAFVVNTLVFNLARLHASSLIAKVVAVVVATFVAWLGNRYWTFADKKNESQGKELIAFFVVNAIGLGVEMIPLWISHNVLGFQTFWADNLSSQIIGTGLGTIFRYFAYKYAVFTGNPAKERG